LLYNENLIKDKLNILQYIDSYTNAIGLSDVEIDLNKIDLVCLRIRDEFPCKFGISEASIFKKTAVFVSCFIETSPLEKSLLNNSNLPKELKAINANAVVALGIAFQFMSMAKVTRSDGEVFYLNQGIKLSWHSYYDILDMLSQGINLQTHFMVLSLLFEQILYKTHCDVQYQVAEFSFEMNKEVDTRRYPSCLDYDEEHPEWDDYIGFWWNSENKQ